ncbi:MAG: nucleotidyltransferase domain-containing protein [Trueperaceae bacterium]
MDGFDELDRLTAALAAERDVQVAVAFGSVARREARFDSDVDVAVLTDRPLTSERRSSLMELVATVTGRAVDLVDLRAAGVPLLRSALVQGRVLVRKDEAAYARLVARMVADAEDFLPLQQRLLRERRERWIR